MAMGSLLYATYNPNSNLYSVTDTLFGMVHRYSISSNSKKVDKNRH